MNQTMLERVKFMLLNAGLPKTFWGEATNIVVYLISKCPSIAIGFKIPIELWYR